MSNNQTLAFVTSIMALTMVTCIYPARLAAESTASTAERPKANAGSTAPEQAPQASAGSTATGQAPKALPEHPMTALETSRDLVIEEIPRAHMGRKLVSEFSGRADVKLAPDVERESVERGRREAKVIDAEFEVAWGSIEELVAEILAGLRSNDAEHMKSLQITPEEFRDILWPEFPESRPGPNVPVDEAWFFLHRTNLSGIGRGLGTFGGQDLKAVRVRFEVGVRRYTNFNLYEGLRIFAVPTHDGPQIELGFVRTLVERNGRWKVYSFKDMD